VDCPVNYLVFSDGQTVRIAVARVVAKISGPSKHLGLAIVHVDAKLQDAFTLADPGEVRPGSPAVAVGTSGYIVGANRARLDQVCFAGRITSVNNSAHGTMTVHSNLPAREGDSGGPLVNESGQLIGIHMGRLTGRLIGIHVGRLTAWVRHTGALAVHPNHPLLARLMADDQQRLRRKPGIGPPSTSTTHNTVSPDTDSPELVISLFQP
jgi:hypothetical protein